MKNLITYEEYLNESIPTYSFDGNLLKVGSSVMSFDGFSGIVVSKEITNGKVSFRDSKGIIHICESHEIFDLNEGMKWWEMTKGILASDVIKAGAKFVGGGLPISSYFPKNWRDKINNKIEKIKGNPDYQKIKNLSHIVSDKLNNDEKLQSMKNQLSELNIDRPIFQSKRMNSKYEKINNQRKNLISEITKHVDSILTEEEKEYFLKINSLLNL